MQASLECTINHLDEDIHMQQVTISDYIIHHNTSNGLKGLKQGILMNTHPPLVSKSFFTVRTIRSDWTKALDPNFPPLGSEARVDREETRVTPHRGRRKTAR